jgi:predicted double-glycine peptidase
MDDNPFKFMNRITFLPLLFLIFVTSSLGQISTAAIDQNNILNSTLFNMPDTRQSTEYSCGAAALQAVLGYWGRDIGEEDMVELLNTDSDSGTYPDDIIRVAHQMGFEAKYRENLTLADIETSLRVGVPVMVDCQAWRSVSEYNESWADEWGNGHWMVVIGLDENNVYFEDPYILGRRGFMTRQEFLARWHNMRGLDDTDMVKQVHMGIAIRNDLPAGSQHFKHVD